MKKLLKINLIALLLPCLVWLRMSQIGMFHISCSSFLTVIGAQIGGIFVVAVVSFFGLLMTNSFSSERDQFLEQQSWKLRSDTELNDQGRLKKEWFSFLSNALVFSLLSLIIFGFLSSYLRDSGVCPAN